jgi:hypothetical protein
MRSTLPLFAFALVASSPLLASELVPVPSFRSVELRGGGSVVVVPGPRQRVTLVDGSSQYTQLRVQRDGKLQIDTCNWRCPQHYRMTIRIEAPNVPDLAVTGGGSIRTNGGFAPQTQLSAAISGGGRIDASALDARDVSAAVHGGGDISVRARASLAAAINGGGLIRYAGHPEVTSAVHGGGLVRSLN